MQLTSPNHPALSHAMAALLCGWLALASAPALAALPKDTKGTKGTKGTTKALKQGLRIKKPPRRRPKARKKGPTSRRAVEKKQKKRRKYKKKAMRALKKRPTRRKPPKKAKKAKQAKKPKGKRARRQLTQWLALGPARLPMPAFHREKQGRYTYGHMLKQRHAPVDQWQPKAGQKVAWLLGRPLKWRSSRGHFKARRGPQVAYLATYIDVDRYAQLKLQLRSHQRLQVFLDGRPIATKARCTTRRRKKHKKHKQRKKHKKRKQRPEARGTSAPPTARPAGAAAKAAPQPGLGQMLRLLARQARLIERQARTIARQLSRIQRTRKPRKPRKRRRSAGLLKTKLILAPGVHTLIVKTLRTPGCVRRWGVWGQLKHTKKSAIPRRPLPVARWQRGDRATVQMAARGPLDPLAGDPPHQRRRPAPLEPPLQPAPRHPMVARRQAVQLRLLREEARQDPLGGRSRHPQGPGAAAGRQTHGRPPLGPQQPLYRVQQDAEGEALQE